MSLRVLQLILARPRPFRLFGDVVTCFLSAVYPFNDASCNMTVILQAVLMSRGFQAHTESLILEFQKPIYLVYHGDLGNVGVKKLIQQKKSQTLEIKCYINIKLYINLVID